jgi:hypothetical protein
MLSRQLIEMGPYRFIFGEGAELAPRPRFDLPHAFPGKSQLSPDRRQTLRLIVKPETSPQNHRFAGFEVIEQLAYFID